MTRVAVSKRLRFEILRRDNHTCRYCGASAPDVPLTVDHVIPVTLGGPTEASNLITACRDCNSGKSSIAADAPIVDDVARRALAWGRAMKIVADEQIQAREVRESLHHYFESAWNRWTWTDWECGQKVERPFEMSDDWRVGVERMYAAGLRVDDFDELIEVAMRARVNNRWKYFCGCAWTRLRQMQERAGQIVDEWERGNSGGA